MELGRRSDDPDAKLKRITAWLDSRSDVESWRVGEITWPAFCAADPECYLPFKKHPAMKGAYIL